MSLFETIAKVQPTITGWCCAEKAEALAAIVLSIRPTVSVEIGVWGGSSFIPIALAHKHINSGMAIGIDPWDAAVSTLNEVPANVQFWGQADHEAIYQGFLSKIRELGLDDVTKILRQTSDQATVPNTIDLLHIDGSHTDQAVKDVIRYAPHVRLGGFCVLDDLDWEKGGVRRAETRLLQFGFKMLYPVGTGAVYQRL